MLVAAVDSFGYRLLFLLHIISIVVAFAPAFVWPVVAVQLRKDGQPIGPVMAKLRAGNNMRIHGPALALAGIFGLGMVGLSDKAIKFSQSWVSTALLIWFVMLGVLFALLVPAERIADGSDRKAEQRVSMLGGILHVLLLLMLIDMIWQPGR
ncbi:MAG: hypothetical protein M3Z46_07365 [Actinomycetota bacterium]|nr:hypothetical protein [Actinomycetota bacterium]